MLPLIINTIKSLGDSVTIPWTCDCLIWKGDLNPFKFKIFEVMLNQQILNEVVELPNNIFLIRKGDVTIDRTNNKNND
jgi:hypothetical protein